MKYKRPAPEGPFSRFMSVDELSGLPDHSITITANEKECAALADLNKLEKVHHLEARFKAGTGSREIHLTGTVKARVTQICVASLEPFDADIIEPIDMRFAAAPPPAMGRKEAGKAMARVADLAEEGLESDPPEPLVDGHIDLGAVASEFFALGLDPYPRKPGVEFVPEALMSQGESKSPLVQDEEKPESPFAALARLRPVSPEKP